MDADTTTTPSPTPSSAPRRGRSGQLRLLDLRDRPEWCLDETTREVGRRGIEAARAALRSSHRGGSDDPGAEHKRSSAA